MDVMPNYPERESILMRKIREREHGTTDRTLKQIQTENKAEDDEPKPKATVDLAPTSLAHTRGRATCSAQTQQRAATNGGVDLLDLSETSAAPPPDARGGPSTWAPGTGGGGAGGGVGGVGGPAAARSVLDDLLGPPVSSTQQGGGGGGGGA